jgi:hypothetical protein
MGEKKKKKTTHSTWRASGDPGQLEGSAKCCRLELEQRPRGFAVARPRPRPPWARAAAPGSVTGRTSASSPAAPTKRTSLSWPQPTATPRTGGESPSVSVWVVKSPTGCSPEAAARSRPAAAAFLPGRADPHLFRHRFSVSGWRRLFATFLLLLLVTNAPTNPTRCSTPPPIRPPPRPCSRGASGSALVFLGAESRGAVCPDLGKGPVLADFRYGARPMLPYWSVRLCLERYWLACRYPGCSFCSVVGKLCWLKFIMGGCVRKVSLLK